MVDFEREYPAMSTTLSEKSCTACRGGVPALTPEVAAELQQQVAAWRLNEDATWLGREFSFNNFREALDFVIQVGELAEQEGHHPVIKFGWGFCRVDTQTKKIRGLHENDFILAAKIDQLYS